MIIVMILMIIIDVAIDGKPVVRHYVNDSMIVDHMSNLSSPTLGHPTDHFRDQK